MFHHCERLRNILEIPMLSEVNKVNKDNPIFVSFLLYVSNPRLFFQNPWSPSVSLDPPPPTPLIMILRVEDITTEKKNPHISEHSEIVKA